ncbi:MAG: DNA polymerase IV [Acidimicrobiales bacterium]
MTGSFQGGPPSIDILHLDMDSFFAAVEVLENPSLAGKPVVVGGTGPRAVVASASYPARAFGIRSAMPMGRARRLCSNLVVIRPRHGAYAEVAEQLMVICKAITPLVEPLSLDEAYLDVSGAHHLFGESEAIAWMLHERVRDELSLSCALGVGRSKLVAKLASKAAKPQVRDGRVVRGEVVKVITPERELAFLHAHSVRALPGVGPKTAERLGRMGVTTVRDLAVVGRARLASALGTSIGEYLDDLATGRDERRVTVDREVKSIGHEETFDVDDFDRPSLERKARGYATSVAAHLRERGIVARTVSVKARFGDFETIVRSKTGRRPVTQSSEIAAIATGLLASIDVDRGVRLLGVSVSNLEEASPPVVQLELFGEAPGPGDDSAAPGGGTRSAASGIATEAIRQRFGRGAIGSADTIGVFESSRRVKRRR